VRRLGEIAVGSRLTMRRYHLFEFLDQSWLPEQVRAAATRYLNAAYGTTPFPALWAAVIARVLGECGADQIVDIGSGSGGPMKLVLAELARLGRRPRNLHLLCGEGSRGCGG